MYISLSLYIYIYDIKKYEIKNKKLRNSESEFFLSSSAKRAAEPGIGDAAPIATCLSFLNKLDISLIIISD